MFSSVENEVFWYGNFCAFSPITPNTRRIMPEVINMYVHCFFTSTVNKNVNITCELFHRMSEDGFIVSHVNVARSSEKH